MTPGSLHWWTAGHSAVCLTRGCEWELKAVTPRHARGAAEDHHNNTGHRVGVERRSRAELHPEVLSVE